MCGIAGIRLFDGSPALKDQVDAMTGQLRHRGPDDSGYWMDGPVGFGHTRLSIIDLAGSPQPMVSPDGRFHLVFNGEIYNYRQVRSELAFEFRTNGDTEVLLAVLASAGPQGLRRLRGQFAFAIHDRDTDEIWLGRDGVGILPLYYAIDDDQLAFASEIKAILPVLERSPELDTVQLGSYLMRRSVPAPHTLLSGVRKVPPGSVLRISASGQVRTERFWTLPAPEDTLEMSDDEAIERIDRQLREAVDDALVADVPVGSYLSGGIDSSLVVAAATKSMRGQPLHTFCAEFGDPRYDESSFAETVSDAFNTTHHVVGVRADTFMDLWEELTWHRDAPLSEPADIAVYRLAQQAREHVKVILSGEGGDELFGGYPKYRFARSTELSGYVPQALRQALLLPAERLLPASANRLRVALRSQTGRRVEDRMATWFAPFTAYECKELLGVDVLATEQAVVHRDAVDLMSRLDLGAWLPDNLLERGDRMSMAASLELRPPFLNPRLIETAMRLPSRLKVRNGETKWVLRQVARRHLPASIIDRPKVGFRVPLDSWFRTGLQDMTHDLLLGADSVAGSVLDQRSIRRLVASHESGRRNEEIRLWTLLSFEVWARMYRRVTSEANPLSRLG
jgi:asparagine synthase (glutamine-hydrolysing)